MKVARRQFLASAAAATAVSIVPRHVLGGLKFVPPSEKVTIALVGAGGQGLANVRSLFQEPDAQVVALADPAEHWNMEAFYFKGVAGRKPVKAEIEKHYAAKTPNFHCADYADFRRLLEKEKGIDAVLCATPDHLHACVCVRAMHGGKHVYCEKPLTHNLWEAGVVAQAARETGVATQMGNAGHSSEGIRRTVEYLRDGVIGPVREVHTWIWAGRYNPTLLGKPTDVVPVPAGLDWDLWLGPRPPRPYHPAYAPVKWRDFWSFGSGSLGDFVCHDFDVMVWAFELGLPQSVQVRPVAYTDAEIVPQGEIGYFHFPARDAAASEGPLVRWGTLAGPSGSLARQLRHVLAGNAVRWREGRHRVRWRRRSAAALPGSPAQGLSAASQDPAPLERSPPRLAGCD